MQTFSGILFVDEIRRSSLIVWYYRLLGARLGRDVFVNTVKVRKGAFEVGRFVRDAVPGVRAMRTRVALRYVFDLPQ